MNVETSQISQEAIFQTQPRFAQITTEIHNPNISVNISDRQFLDPTPIPDTFVQAFVEDQPEVKQELITVNDIQDEITQARERIAREWEHSGREMRQYEVEFDQVCFATLERFKYKAPEAYAEAKRQLHEYTVMQLKTAIGERLNAALSSWKYEIKEDGIYFEGSNEKAVEMFKRGRDLRKKNGRPVDWAREAAEVVGIEKMEAERVIDSDTGEEVFDPATGDIWISFSHRGNMESKEVKKRSVYKHNFYDIFTVKIDEDGKKYIEARRYTSTLKPQESFEKFGKFDRENYPEDLTPTAEHFLANPIKLRAGEGPFQTADDIHAYLHREHTAMNSSQIESIFTQIEMVFQEYLKNPSEANLRMVFNAADEKAGLINGKSGGSVKPVDRLELAEPIPITQQDMIRWQNQEVRTVDTGCGLSSLNVSVSKDGTVIGDPYSVAEFARQSKNKEALEDYLNDPNLCRCQGEKPHFHCIGTVKEKEPEKKENQNNEAVKEEGPKKKIEWHKKIKEKLKKRKEEGKKNVRVKEKPCPYKVVVGKGITVCPMCGTGKTC